jgi:hypothetical protein
VTILSYSTRDGANIVSMGKDLRADRAGLRNPEDRFDSEPRDATMQSFASQWVASPSAASRLERRIIEQRDR